MLSVSVQSFATKNAQFESELLRMKEEASGNPDPTNVISNL